MTIRYKRAQAAAREAATGGPAGEGPDQPGGVASYLARASRAFTARKDALLRRHPGMRVLARYRMLPELLVRVRGTAAARSLAADRGVRSAVPVRIHRLAATPLAAGSQADRHRDARRRSAARPAAARPARSTADLELINDLAAQASGDRGAGTAVAVLDDGTDYHERAFGSCPRPGAPGCRVLAYRDFAAPPRHGLSFTGHGTNVAGQVLKVAPGTRLVVGNVFHRTARGGVVSTADLMSGLNWVLTEAARRSPAYSFRAVNLSLGNPFTYHANWCGENPVTGAFSQLLAAGIQPVVAAGNDAYQGTAFRTGITMPACAPGALAVGAVFDGDYGRVTVSQPGSRCSDQVTYADKIACFSQGGPRVGLLAPGWRETAAGVTKSGTSQATPLVTGAIAALASGSMARTTSQIVTAMRLAGQPVQDPRTGLMVPRLDVWAAEQRLARGYRS
ncbi:MAG TPA: S8 family serine peptidase [Streptosporangiaceae bacterium]|nr:S8 family serine peptidase [Streptosporangiaceae bacterium]